MVGCGFRGRMVPVRMYSVKNFACRLAVALAMVRNLAAFTPSFFIDSTLSH